MPPVRSTCPGPVFCENWVTVACCAATGDGVGPAALSVGGARGADGSCAAGAVAPTGAGKTLAGFLPSLVDLSRRTPRKPGTRAPGIHTLYISPLKALATDIQRNLAAPVEEMGLRIEIETRTGDTSQHRRQRQKLRPPDILLTTPEQLALLIASKDAEAFFSDLKTVIFDELHSLVTSKRGHLLSLGLARLRKLRPDLQTIGLSATVSEPGELQRWLVGQRPGSEAPMADLITVAGGARPQPAGLNSS